MSVQWTEQVGQLRSRYNAGFDAYCAGLSIADLHDPIERRGWWSANRAQGLAETSQWWDHEEVDRSQGESSCDWRAI